MTISMFVSTSRKSLPVPSVRSPMLKFDDSEMKERRSTCSDPNGYLVLWCSNRDASKNLNPFHKGILGIQTTTQTTNPRDPITLSDDDWGVPNHLLRKGGSGSRKPFEVSVSGFLGWKCGYDHTGHLRIVRGVILFLKVIDFEGKTVSFSESIILPSKLRIINRLIFSVSLWTNQDCIPMLCSGCGNWWGAPPWKGPETSQFSLEAWSDGWSTFRILGGWAPRWWSDHPISHEVRPFGRGTITHLIGGLTITVVINHTYTLHPGMILHVHPWMLGNMDLFKASFSGSLSI